MSLAVGASVFIFLILFMIFSGIPIVFALGLVSTISLFMDSGTRLFPALAHNSWGFMADFVVGAIPMFVLMGFLMSGTGLAKRVYSAIQPMLERFPGALLHSNIVVGAVFAACSGSTVASCATIGAVSLPEMKRRGYERGIAAGSVAAGSTLGTLIPPSITLLVYGVIANISVAKLFIGGIIPGLVLAALYIIYIAIRVKFQPSLVSQEGQEVRCLQPWNVCILSVLKIWPIILLIIAVLGSIYTGFATPSEAAAVGCVGTFLVAASYGLITKESLKTTIIGSTVTSSMILIICMSGRLCGFYLSHSGIASSLSKEVMQLPLSPLMILILIVFMYLILGMLMDGLTMIIITIPIVAPIMASLGYDLIWFGLLVTMMTECGLLTPPVGMNLFILQGLQPDLPFAEIVRGCFPFFLVILVMVVIMTVFPQLVTFLPDIAFG